MASRSDSHEVFNQSPPYADVDLFGTDQALRDAVAANGAGGEGAALAKFGRRWGTAEMFEQARLANENPPKLKAFDAKGHRRDMVEFHPAYHALHGGERPRRGCMLRLGGRTATRGRGAPPRSRAPRATTWWRRSRTGTCARSP